MSEKTETPTMKKVGKKIVLGTDTVVIPFKYDLAGRMISRASDTFAFDADGNQVSAVEENIGSRFSWSSDNRLLRVEKDIPCSKHFRRKCNLCPKIVTLSEGYAYLPLDWRRVFRKTDDRTYVSVFDGDDESHEYLVKEDRDHRWWKCLKHKKCNCLPPKPQKRLDLIREFIGGPGTDDLEVTKFHGRALSFLKDALGSTIALANRGGNPVARIAYDVWGNMRWPDKPGHGVKPCRDEDLDDLLDRFDFGRSFGFDHDPWHYGRFFGKALTPYLYAGRRLDSFTGQYFNRNRYYQPKYGRFISRDPIGFNGGLNLWNYAGCNPLLYTDPFGLTYFGETKDLGAVLGIGVLQKDPVTGKIKKGFPLTTGEQKGYTTQDISKLTVDIGEPCIALGSDPKCPKYGIWSIQVRVFLPAVSGNNNYPYFSNTLSLDGSKTTFSVGNMTITGNTGETKKIGPGEFPVQLLNVICHCISPDLP